MQCTASEAKIGVVVAVDHRLIVHRRMNGGGDPAGDAEFTVQDIKYRDNAVGCARGIGNDALRALQNVVVVAVNDRRINVRDGRVRQEQMLGAGGEMCLGGCFIEKGTGAFKKQIDVQIAPREFSRIGFIDDSNLVVADIQIIPLKPERIGETAMGGVVAGEIGKGFDIGQFVDGNDFEF